MSTSSKIRAGAAFVELKSKDADFIRGMKKAQRRLEAFGAAARSVGTRLIAGGGGIVAAGAIATRVFAKVGDDLDKISKRTGIAVESLSGFGFAAEQSGASLEQFEKGIQGMQRALFDASRGTKTQIETLERLGLTYEQIKDLTPEEQFTILADRLSKVSDMSTRAGVAMQIFGRAGRQMLPMFEDGAAGLKAYRDQAEKLGLIFSTKSTIAAAEFTDILNIANRVIRALVFQIGASLAPVATKAAEAIILAAAAANRWVRENRQLIVIAASVGAVLVIAGGAILGVGIAAAVAAFAIGGLATAFGFLGTVVGIAGSVLAALLSPVALIGAAIIGLGAIVVSQSQSAKNVASVLLAVFKSLASDVFSVISSITDALLAGDLKLASQIAGKGIELVWTSMIVALKSKWVDFVAFIQKSLLQLPKKVNGLMIALEVGLGSALGKGGEFIGKGPRLPSGGSDLSGLIDKGAAAKQLQLQESIQSLTDQLKALQAKNPDGVFGGLGSTDFSSLLNSLQMEVGDKTRRSAAGLFASNALGTLATKEEKDIQANTKTIVDQMNEALGIMREGDGGLVVQ